MEQESWKTIIRVEALFFNNDRHKYCLMAPKNLFHHQHIEKNTNLALGTSLVGEKHINELKRKESKKKKKNCNFSAMATKMMKCAYSRKKSEQNLQIYKCSNMYAN